jgi:hypothetical protein
MNFQKSYEIRVAELDTATTSALGSIRPRSRSKKPFKTLTDKMSPERQARASAHATRMLLKEEARTLLDDPHFKALAEALDEAASAGAAALASSLPPEMHEGIEAYFRSLTPDSEGGEAVVGALENRLKRRSVGKG